MIKLGRNLAAVLVVGLITATCTSTDSDDSSTILLTSSSFASTTSSSTTSTSTTSSSTTSISTTEPTTTSPPTTAPQTTSPPTTPPTPSSTSTTVVSDIVATGSFDFASGTDPQVRVSVDVALDQSGPWLAAGFDANPLLGGSEYWIRFTIENEDSLGTITSLDISGSGDGTLGSDVCPDQAPIPPASAHTCVVGPFPVDAGPQSVGFTVTATGERQTSGGGEFFSPPITAPGYMGALTSFLFAFETSTEPHEGLLIEGRASGSTVDIDIPGELVATISVECASPGAGAGYPVVAYSITTYDADGGPMGGCEDIPTVALPYTLDGLSDTAVNYTGS